MRSGAPEILRAQWQVLALRFGADDLERLNRGHLLYGLLVTWAVGIGRYWDHPHPYLLQSLGLGSIAVMACLCVFLYAAIWPLKPASWSFENLFTFVSLTSLPALLYAIPVERFLSLEIARALNIGFLSVVALWRVTMLARYLSKRTELRGGVLAAALLLPLALIIVVLTLLNLEQAVFNIMAGLRDSPPTPSDSVLAFLWWLSTGAVVLSPGLLLVYLGAILYRRRSAGTRAV